MAPSRGQCQPVRLLGRIRRTCLPAL